MPHDSQTALTSLFIQAIQTSLEEKSNNNNENHFNICVGAEAFSFKARKKATTACAQPQDMSSGTQLSYLIRNRVEFGKHSLPLLHPPQLTVNSKTKDGWIRIRFSLGTFSVNDTSREVIAERQPNIPELEYKQSRSADIGQNTHTDTATLILFPSTAPCLKANYRRA